MQKSTTNSYHSTRTNSPYERINEEIETQYLVDEIDEHLQSLDKENMLDRSLRSRSRHRSTSRERKKRQNYTKSPIDKTGNRYLDSIYSPDNETSKPELRVEDLYGFPLRPNHLQVRVSQFDGISPIS